MPSSLGVIGLPVTSAKGTPCQRESTGRTSAFLDSKATWLLVLSKPQLLQDKSKKQSAVKKDSLVTCMAVQCPSALATNSSTPDTMEHNPST